MGDIWLPRKSAKVTKMTLFLAPFALFRGNRVFYPEVCSVISRHGRKIPQARLHGFRAQSAGALLVAPLKQRIAESEAKLKDKAQDQRRRLGAASTISDWRFQISDGVRWDG
jgi:hypothetical protein